jgi:hypothetical protein
MAMRYPILTQHFQGSFREWYIAILGSFALPNMELQPITVNVFDL